MYVFVCLLFLSFLLSSELHKEECTSLRLTTAYLFWEAFDQIPLYGLEATPKDKITIFLSRGKFLEKHYFLLFSIIKFKIYIISQK